MVVLNRNNYCKRVFCVSDAPPKGKTPILNHPVEKGPSENSFNK